MSARLIIAEVENGTERHSRTSSFATTMRRHHRSYKIFFLQDINQSHVRTLDNSVTRPQNKDHARHRDMYVSMSILSIEDLRYQSFGGPRVTLECRSQSVACGGNCHLPEPSPTTFHFLLYFYFSSSALNHTGNSRTHRSNCSLALFYLPKNSRRGESTYCLPEGALFEKEPFSSFIFI